MGSEKGRDRNTQMIEGRKEGRMAGNTVTSAETVSTRKRKKMDREAEHYEDK